MFSRSLFFIYLFLRLEKSENGLYLPSVFIIQPGTTGRDCRLGASLLFGILPAATARTMWLYTFTQSNNSLEMSRVKQSNSCEKPTALLSRAAEHRIAFIKQGCNRPEFLSMVLGKTERQCLLGNAKKTFTLRCKRSAFVVSVWTLCHIQHFSTPPLQTRGVLSTDCTCWRHQVSSHATAILNSFNVSWAER